MVCVENMILYFSFLFFIHNANANANIINHYMKLSFIAICVQLASRAFKPYRLWTREMGEKGHRVRGV